MHGICVRLAAPVSIIAFELSLNLHPVFPVLLVLEQPPQVLPAGLARTSYAIAAPMPEYSWPLGTESSLLKNCWGPVPCCWKSVFFWELTLFQTELYLVLVALDKSTLTLSQCGLSGIGQWS